MKIVIATHHFPPHYVGGVELITLRLARWLKQQNQEVEIVCVESIFGKDKMKVVVERDMFENLAVNRLTISFGQGISSFKETYDNQTIGYWFRDYLRSLNADLVHIHSGYLLSSSPILAAKQLGLPVVVSLHDYWFVCPQIKLLGANGTRCDGDRTESKCAWCLLTNRRRYLWMDKLSMGLAGTMQRWLASQRLFNKHPWGQLLKMTQERQKMLLDRLKAADLILTQSPFLLKKLISNGLSANQARLVPYGLELSNWPQIKNKTGSDGVLHIGYLGQIVPQKGLHFLIEALKLLRSSGRCFHLTIYGDVEHSPSYVRRLMRKAEDSGRVTFAGRYENHRLPEILAGLDVIVVPSHWYEIGPIVTLEAFATKTPVVATNLPNMNAQITHGVNGLLFTANSVRDLAHQLQRLIDEPQLLEHLKSNIKPVKTFDQEAREIYEIYSEILDKES